MSSVKTLYVKDRQQWREWLSENFDKEKEIWLIFPQKASDRPSVSYNDAVEEALCFGWIDSTVRAFDSESHIQRFTPRGPKSSYSQPNRERLRWLDQQHLLHPSVQETVNKLLAEEFVIPEDILAAVGPAEETGSAAWPPGLNTHQAVRRGRRRFDVRRRHRGAMAVPWRLAAMVTDSAGRRVVDAGAVSTPAA